MNQNNKFIGYMQHGTKQQPNRTDSSNRLGAPIHITADSTVLQDSPSWVYKGEWNGTIGQHMFAEFRAGQFGYNFGLDSNTNGTRYESLTTNQILGGGRDWELRRRRNQYTGALSYFKDNFARRLAQLQVRRRVPRREGRDALEPGLRRQRDPLRQRRAHQGVGDDAGAVRLANNADSWSALATTSFFVTDTWTIDRLTLNLGARFDRYRVWLPEQSLPAGRFVPAALNFAEVSEVVVFNHIVPRFGATYDLTGDGKTVLKGNWGRFYFNPGVNLADAVNPNTANQYADWTLERSEQRSRVSGRRSRRAQTRFGGVANAAIDPNLENSYTDEASVFVERAVMNDLGVRVGYVWKKDNDGWQQVNALRPLERLQRAGHGGRSGARRQRGHDGRQRHVSAFNLDNTGARLEPTSRRTSTATRARTRRSKSRPTSATATAGR